jgi:hypothetical protein
LLLRAATPLELEALSLFELALSCRQFGLLVEGEERARRAVPLREMGEWGSGLLDGFEVDDRPALLCEWN